MSRLDTFSFRCFAYEFSPSVYPRFALQLIAALVEIYIGERLPIRTAHVMGECSSRRSVVEDAKITTKDG